MVYPVICTAERMLTPGRVVLWSEPGALKVVQTAHGNIQPILALLHHAVKQIDTSHSAALETLDRLLLVRSRAVGSLFGIILAQLSAQTCHDFVKLPGYTVYIP